MQSKQRSAVDGRGRVNAFAEWQPRYAEQGVATFPVEDKRPCVQGWQNVGLRGSAQLALKFPEAEALGFQCGPRNRITLVDIDSADDTIVAEAVKLFGESPVLWRTGSGNYAMAFHYNGEGRRIRPIDGLPIDVLGGGSAVVPPSEGAKGRYRFVKGGISRLGNLPAMRLPRGLTAANENGIPKGTRNNWLFKRLLREVRYCDDLDALLDIGRTRNMECTPPLSDNEVVGICRSVWGYEIAGNNWVGRKARASTDREEILSLSAFPPGPILLMLLRVSHPKLGETFAIDQGKTAELLGWDRSSVRTAIKFLMHTKHLERVYWGGRGKGDPHLYQLKRT